MKTIFLTKGQFTLVDDDIFEKLNKFKWNAKGSFGKFYAVRMNSADKNGKRSTIYMHRVILNCPEGLCVDHIDGNSLNNQSLNLRIATNSQNCKNQTGRSTTGLPKGVSIKKGKIKKKYRAQIRADKKIHLGYFNTPEEASKAHNEAAIRLHGEFANLKGKT